MPPLDTDNLFRLRRAELRRRVEALPAEVETWRAAASKPDALDMKAHFSQLLALSVMVKALTDGQLPLLAALDQSTAASFGDDSLRVVKEIIRTQKVWDFFRDKLELRHSPAFNRQLWTADTIAYDCHRPVLKAAADAGILPPSELREPPLTYCTAEFSPATWVRGSRPNDGRAYQLGEARLPIPVIEVPWDHLENLWELCSLLHEVGHDIEADLKLREPLKEALGRKLQDAGTPPKRIQRWIAWQAEIFADLVAIRLGGPAFIDGLIHLLVLPPAQVLTLVDADPHPTHYVRILLCCHYARTLVPGEAPLEQHADRMLATWKDLYGEGGELAAFIADFAAVCEGLMATVLPSLQGHSVAQMIAFSAGDDRNMRSAAGYLRTGMNKPVAIRPRHCVCAARIAASEAAAQPPATLAASLKNINDNLMQLVRENDGPELRASDNTPAHKAFVAGLARSLPEDFERPEASQ
ncbi:MAG: hypothetical protein JWP22_4177 [Ramlibacter sp.]|nr:hypothetical protein [Ramlibacter sp.]